ncbi:hypothetical protein DFH08DRAFT_797399 [Mycena albidolilacea]|uniref:Uncharacterized protein n=1 Tax=Mycena albidolilacea TaxID=1033008 RepID=A0AAD7AR33_9AGAR|nr:hypothetical protein DFH08DRAFT_797399 [Mycena albidolilacea]
MTSLPPPLTEPSGHLKSQTSARMTLDSYSNEVQDKFFSLTKAVDSEALTNNETRELMYFYTILRFVDHFISNYKIYTILCENCIGETASLQASNLNEAYQQSSELSDVEKTEVKVLGSNLNSKAMEFISDNENENDMARKKLVPTLPKLPKGLSEVEHYNFQQKLEPDAQAVLMQGVGYKLIKAKGMVRLVKEEIKWMKISKLMVENSGTVLEKINEHAKDGIHI